MPSERPSPVRPGAATSLVEVPYRRKLRLVAALTVTLFVTTMNQTVVSTAAQNIVGDLGRFELFTWLFAGFALASAVSVPVVGKLTDRIGTKPVIIWALALFLVSSAAAGSARTMPQLIAARVFQGAGFAGVLGSVWIIMASMWAPQDRAKWLGVTSAGFTLSGVLGPVIGGVVSDALSWRWVFYLNLPVGGGAFLLLLAWFPAIAKSERRRKFDVAGALAFSAFAAIGLFALSSGGKSYEWDSPIMAILLTVSFGSLIAFLWIEPRAEDPMVPLALFRSRIFSGAMVASLTMTITFTVVAVFMPLYVQGVRGDRATMSAFPLMANAIGIAIGSNVGGQILARLGYVRELAAGGLAVATLAIVYYSTIGPATPMSAIVVVSVVLGIGVSFGFTSFTVPVQNAMPQKSLGVVTTSLQFARTLGMALASAGLGALLLSQLAVGSAHAGDPRSELSDPATLVSQDRLDEARGKFEADPALGLAAYEVALEESRADLNSALRIVFRVAAMVSGAGALIALVTFAGGRTKKSAGTRPLPSDLETAKNRAS